MFGILAGLLQGAGTGCLLAIIIFGGLYLLMYVLVNIKAIIALVVFVAFIVALVCGILSVRRALRGEVPAASPPEDKKNREPTQKPVVTTHYIEESPKDETAPTEATDPGAEVRRAVEEALRDSEDSL